MGVAVFFLISGFLLYRPFARARYERRGVPALGAYAARRALRIFPAYWVALLGAVVLIEQAPLTTDVLSAQGIYAYFGLLQVYDADTLVGGISAAWTLSVELSFYLLLPLWALLMQQVPCRSRNEFVRSEMLGLGGLFVVGVIWTAIAAGDTGPNPNAVIDVTLLNPWLYVLPGFLEQFALGMGLAVVSVALADRSHQPGAIRLIERASWLPWLLASLAFLGLGQVKEWFQGSYAAEEVMRHSLQALVAFGLLLPAIFGDPDRGLVRRLLANRALLWIGLVSYGVYLWHVTVMTEMNDFGALDGLSPVWYVVLALALTLLAAAASFYAVERPALRLGRRLSKRRTSQDADARMHDLRQHERPEPGLP